MSVHHFTVKDFIFPLIANGRKDLEVRVADSRRLEVAVDHVIVFNGEIRRSVVAIRRYGSFESMLDVEKPARVLPGYNAEQIIHALRKFYPPEKEKLGVLVFEVKAATSS